MPQSKKRKPTHPTRPTPPRTVETAPNALVAEATGGTLGFAFRGHRFVIDYATADFGKAMFAMKLAARTGAGVVAAFEKMLDCLEAVLGEEQLRVLYEVAPDVFSSEDTQREFWNAFSAMTVGADLGEQPAS